MRRDELKPCPFCGWTEIYIEPDERGSGSQWVLPLHVGCCLCGVNILCTDAETEEEASKVWNRRAALSAALSIEQTNPVKVKVKALVWEPGVVDYAKPLPGMKYVACSTTPPGAWAWWLDGAPETRAVHPSEEAAKAAAQQDYEARIRSALVDAQADADVVERWQPIETAPRDGKHCILAVQEGAFIYSVQGAFDGKQWNAVHREGVEPLCWMPNCRIPSEFLPAGFSSLRPAEVGSATTSSGTGEA